MTYGEWLDKKGQYRTLAGPVKMGDNMTSAPVFKGYSDALGEEWEIVTAKGKFSVMLDGMTATTIKETENA